MSHVQQAVCITQETYGWPDHVLAGHLFKYIEQRDEGSTDTLLEFLNDMVTDDVKSVQSEKVSAFIKKREAFLNKVNNNQPRNPIRNEPQVIKELRQAKGWSHPVLTEHLIDYIDWLDDGSPDDICAFLDEVADNEDDPNNE
jgi:hypothetical protein